MAWGRPPGCACGRAGRPLWGWPAPLGRSCDVCCAAHHLITQQGKLWERRMSELLLGTPRRGRNRQPRSDEGETQVPGGGISLSLPGLGDRLAARR
jgi:hypothetical protein